MQLKIEPLPDESVVFEDGVYTSRPMVFGVTNQAVYVTKEQHFKQESWRLERIPIPAITEVCIKKERSIVVWLLGALTFTGGLILAAGFAWNVYRALPGTKVPIVPWPYIFMAIGITIPILGRGRRILSIRVGKKLHKWKAGVLIHDQQVIHDLQDRFVEACRSVGIHVTGEVVISATPQLDAPDARS
jgi:hypothetical protein